VRTLLEQAVGESLYKIPPFQLVSARQCVRDFSMIALTLQKTKDGYKLELKVDVHQVALSLIAIFSFFA
jgi:hypothetical protein